MIDIKFLRDNPDLVKLKSEQKGYKVEVNKILELDHQRRELIVEIDHLRQKRNDLSKIKLAHDLEQTTIDSVKTIKNDLNVKIEQLSHINQDFDEYLRQIPNMALDDVPIGQSEDDNVIVRQVGDLPKFSFEPKPHHLLADSLGLIDNKRAAKISGSRFVYLKADLVKLQFALINFVFSALSDQQIIDKIIKDNHLQTVNKPFTPILPPALLKTQPYLASSRLDEENVTYKIAQDDLWLNASAEHTLCTMYWDEVLDLKDLPIRYIGYSTSFRREAGTYGKDMEGIFRLHQFDKLEMEVFSTPEDGLNEHLLLVAIQEYLVSSLDLPYQVLQKCTADIGKPNAQGVDIETYLPGQAKYRETHSADYMTDYQSRDLKIRFKDDANRIQFVHTNDATAFALSRILIAIIENYQTAEGRIIIPKILQPLMNQEII